MNSVRAKLYLGFSVLATVFILWAGVNWLVIREAAEATEALHDRAVASVRALGQAQVTLQQIRGRTFYHLATADPTRHAALEQQLRVLDTQFVESLRTAKDLVTDPDETAALETVASQFGSFVEQRDNTVLPASRDARNTEALTLMVERTGPIFSNAAETLRSVTEHEIASAGAFEKQAEEAYGTALMLAAAGVAIVLIAAPLVAVSLSSSISSRLTELTDMARVLREGRLEHRARIQGNDEITELATCLNEMADALQTKIVEQRSERDELAEALSVYGDFVERVARGDLTVREVSAGKGELATLGSNLTSMGTALRSMTQRIHESVGSLSSASAEIQATSQEHAAGATESASAVAETVASIDEVAQSAQQMTQTAEKVQQISHRSIEASGSGQAEVRRSLEAMDEVRNRVESIAERILALSEQAQEVGQIIRTVNELAEQSNVLALNASIEAARAGEQGRGFAVVAQEIRALAEQSREATRVVRDMLSNIQKSTSKAVLAAEEGTKSVTKGVETVGNAGRTIQKLSDTIAEAASSADHIRSSAQQQAQGIAQISDAMRSIDEAARQGVEGTRHIEQAARQLNDVSSRLQHAVSAYQV